MVKALQITTLLHRVPCASYSRQIFKNITLVLIKALRMLTNYQRESGREN